MYAQAWASHVEKRPENNQISSEELCRKVSRLGLVEKGVKISDQCRHFAEDVSYLAQPLARLGVATSPSPSRGPLGVQVDPYRGLACPLILKYLRRTLSLCVENDRDMQKYQGIVEG